MILKKPYAFLIKYFKLIHVFLVVPLCYLLYRTNVILHFFQQYLQSEQIVAGRDFNGELFNTWMFALPFIIIFVLGILLGIMFYKKKPKIFYIYNILVMIALLVVYNIGYNLIGTLEVQLLETRVVRLIRDVFTIVILFQGIGLLLTFIRATGFDIKKFDFNRDLEQLDITEADAEEFEVDVNFETNVVKRDFKKSLRYARYIYVENKYIINGLFLILVSIICFIVYMNLTIYNKTYKQSQPFSATEFALSINNSYLTNKNHLGKKITDNYLLIVEMDIKANYESMKLNTTRVELKITDETYYPNNLYNSSLVDLGNIYNGDFIDTNGFQNQLLVYEIPKELIGEKMTIRYLDDIKTGRKKLNPKYIKIKLTPYDLDKQEELKAVNKGDSVILNEELYNSTSIKISNFDIQENFKLNYQHCTKMGCYDSIEYLTPILNTNYDKVLLKVEGNLVVAEGLKNKNIDSLYKVINYFGKIKYEVGGKTKYYTPLTRISPKKTNDLDAYYIEIPKEVLESDKINLIIDVRNKIYEYKIK